MDTSSKKQNIILTGFMGTGKTTVGKLLAEMLAYDFVDTDAMIESAYGLTIPQIFEQFDEPTFRQMERDIALALGEQTGLVISTGGQMMLHMANVAALAGNGRIICLTATPETVMARVMGDGVAERPLLAVPNPQQRIRDLLDERRPKYQQFSQIATDDVAPQVVAQQIIELLEEQEIGDY